VVRSGRCGRLSAGSETGVRRRRSIDYSPTTAWVGGTEPNAAGSDGGPCRRPPTRVRRPPDPRQSDGRGTERRVRTRIRRPTGRLRTLRSHYLSNFVIVSADIIPSPVTTAMVTRVDCRGSCVPDDVVGLVGAGALDVRTLITFRRCWRRPARLRGRSPSLRSVESAGGRTSFRTDDSNDRNRIRYVQFNESGTSTWCRGSALDPTSHRLERWGTPHVSTEKGRRRDDGHRSKRRVAVATVVPNLGPLSSTPRPDRRSDASRQTADPVGELAFRERVDHTLGDTAFRTRLLPLRPNNNLSVGRGAWVTDVPGRGRRPTLYHDHRRRGNPRHDGSLEGPSSPAAYRGTGVQQRGYAK
jgi:hypothetical protein